MNYLKRKLYRFRARIYARLPRNKSLIKMGIILLLMVGALFLRHFFWQDEKDEDAVQASAQEVQQETQKKEKKTLFDLFRNTLGSVSEDGTGKTSGSRSEGAYGGMSGSMSADRQVDTFASGPGTEAGEVSEGGYLTVEFAAGSIDRITPTSVPDGKLVGGSDSGQGGFMAGGQAGNGSGSQSGFAAGGQAGNGSGTQGGLIAEGQAGNTGGNGGTQGEFVGQGQAEDGTLAGEVPGAVETGTLPVISMTGLRPLCYPELSEIVGVKYLKENLKQLAYLKDTFYIVNATTKMTETDFNAERFLATDLSMEKKEGSVQILIYHTHASEAFLDSRKGEKEDTVIGMGELLKKYLTEKYGYTVLHDMTVFDRKNGADNRSYAYNDALPHIEEVLKQNPDIKVVIDLHRDAGAKRVVTLQGKQVAKVMLFNGLCRNTAGELKHLPNKNLSSNLAFSFQMKLIGDEMYPGLFNRIFLKDYRYNMHLAERYLLIELGTENNTVAEAANAMEPLADVLAQVLR